MSNIWTHHIFVNPSSSWKILIPNPRGDQISLRPPAVHFGACTCNPAAVGETSFQPPQLKPSEQTAAVQITATISVCKPTLSSEGRALYTPLISHILTVGSFSYFSLQILMENNSKTWPKIISPYLSIIFISYLSQFF